MTRGVAKTAEEKAAEAADERAVEEGINPELALRKELGRETPESPATDQQAPPEPMPVETPEASLTPLEKAVDPALENRGHNVHAHAPKWEPRAPNSGW